MSIDELLGFLIAHFEERCNETDTDNESNDYQKGINMALKEASRFLLTVKALLGDTP